MESVVFPDLNLDPVTEIDLICKPAVAGWLPPVITTSWNDLMEWPKPIDDGLDLGESSPLMALIQVSEIW